ncbi:MAG: helix-turn-helix transcriptional regulator [Balneolaceae bacterium]|nr:helix-turn-helix transcriptional regulator [Balneolaceae bacterium]MDR9447250.1 helix-turn-helix transcriptional regulator [Balneolaceae bacterium]
MTFEIIVEKTATGYAATVSGMDVYTTAATITELYENLVEAINFALEDENITIQKKDLQLRINLPQFFRHYRVLNAKVLAERINIHPTLLSHYVQGKKVPSQKQVNRILNGIQEIGQELADLQFIQQ